MTSAVLVSAASHESEAQDSTPSQKASPLLTTSLTSGCLSLNSGSEMYTPTSSVDYSTANLRSPRPNTNSNGDFINSDISLRYPPTANSGVMSRSWRPNSGVPSSPFTPPRTAINTTEDLPTLVSYQSGQEAVIMPGSLTQYQLEYHHSYAIHLGNGVFTRLIPANELPYDISGIPRTQETHNGMIILPKPRGRDPEANQVPSDQQSLVPIQRVQHVQSNSVGQRYTPTLQNRLPPVAAPDRKVYCSKWIHEGTCAFAQTGCRYKHEMPMDRATQESVGLSNGLPNWYIRRFGIELRRPQAQGLSQPVDDASQQFTYNRTSSYGTIGQSRVPLRVDNDRGSLDHEYTAQHHSEYSNFATPRPARANNGGKYGSTTRLQSDNGADNIAASNSKLQNGSGRFVEPFHSNQRGTIGNTFSSNPYAMLGSFEENDEQSSH